MKRSACYGTQLYVFNIYRGNANDETIDTAVYKDAVGLQKNNWSKADGILVTYAVIQTTLTKTRHIMLRAQESELRHALRGWKQPVNEQTAEGKE